MKKTLLTLLLCLTFSVGTFAQGFIRVFDPTQAKQANTETKLVLNSAQNSQKKIADKKVSEPDTVYYADIVRRFSWTVGLGDTISLNEAKKRSEYYRFTMKNDKGHWQHIECMSGDDYAEKSYCGSYFGNSSDTIFCKNEEAFELIDSAVQFFEYTDYNGDVMLEERAYDKDNNFLYAVQFNQVPDGRYIVSYTDSNGFPIEFSEDDNYTYGSVCALTYDDDGYNTLIEYMDAAGYSRKYRTGVYQIHRKVENGKIIERSFLNAIGELMNDVTGTAIAKYDRPNKFKTTVTRYDKNNQPIKPNTPFILEKCMKCTQTSDEYGYIKSYEFFAIENGVDIPDEIEGVHKLVLDRNDSDNSFKCYNKQGDLLKFE